MSLLDLPLRIDCDCGAVHTCEIRRVVCGAGALGQLPSLLADCRVLTVVSDGNTAPLAADELARTLAAAGHRVHRAHFAGRQPLVPDEAAIAHIEAALPPDADALVGVGSGVINDLCKYLGGRRGLPYLIAATAPSMDGYASKGAAMILGGMKVTVPAPPPAWIVGDDEVLATAPLPMLQSGIGDLLGKYSCLDDWRLGALLLDEPFCPHIHAQVLAAADATAADIPAILARQPTAVGRLFAHLVEVGVAMSLAGNSRPASGSEHHLAHFYEITGLQRQRPCLAHGIDVAYGALVTAWLRQQLAADLAAGRVAALGDAAQSQAGPKAEGLAPAKAAAAPQIAPPDAAQAAAFAAPDAPQTAAFDVNAAPAEDDGAADGITAARCAAWQGVYGSLAPAVARLQRQAGFYAPAARAARLATARQRRPQLTALLAGAVSPQRLAALLAASGLSLDTYRQTYGAAVLKQSIRWAKDLKDRYTLFDLLDDLALLPRYADAAVQWLATLDGAQGPQG